MTRQRATPSILLALALVVGGCGAGAPSPIAAPSDGAPPSAPAPTDVPTAPPATTEIPEGFTPSTDEVVLRAWAVPDVVGDEPLLPVTVLADGSIVIPRVEGFGAPGVRRLTPAGLAALRERARATGLFTTSRTIPPLRPPESGFVTYRVELRDSDRPVTVEATNLFPSAEGTALIELADAVIGYPEAARPIPAGDYVDADPAPVPYRATTARLTAETVAFPPGSWRRPAVAVSAVGWPIAGGIREAGAPLAVPGEPDRTLRCALVAGDDEARVRAAFRAAGVEQAWRFSLDVGWDLLDPAGPGILRVTVRPFLPDEAPACDADPLPAAPQVEPLPPPTFDEFWQAAGSGVTVAEARLVRVEVTRLGEEGGPVASLLYLADGSILDLLDPPPPAVAVGVRELGATGLARLRDLLASPSLPRVDLDEPLAAEVASATAYAVEGLFGTRWVSARVTDQQPSAAAAAVIALAQRLAAPETWAGNDGWDGGYAAVQPWLPLRVRLVVERYEGEDTTGLPLVAAVRWPFQGTLDEPRCEELGYNETDVIIRALNTAGVAEEGGGTLEGAYRLAGRTPGAVVQVSLAILLPGEDLGCP